MDQRGVSWDAFEEKAKLAFVADAPRSRLTIKTHVGGKRQPRLQVVARVVHEPLDVVKYQTSEPAHVPRLTRLLRFAMQEVLGPMRVAAPTSAATSAPAAPAAATDPSSNEKKKKKKKNSKKKH